MREVDGVVKPTPAGWVQNRAVDLTARKISERIVQVVKITLRECLQQRIEEQTVGILLDEENNAVNETPSAEEEVQRREHGEQRDD